MGSRVPCGSEDLPALIMSLSKEVDPPGTGEHVQPSPALWGKASGGGVCRYSGGLSSPAARQIGPEIKGPEFNPR